MGRELNVRPDLSTFPFSPCGRRWRETPDEGSLRSILINLPTPHPSRARSRDPPSPARGEGETLLHHAPSFVILVIIQSSIGGLDPPTQNQNLEQPLWIKLLEQQGTGLPFPYSSQVRGRLRELRTRFGKTRLRILYFADSRRILMLLHGIVKAAEKLPEPDIQTAEKRMTIHSQRLERRKE